QAASGTLAIRRAQAGLMKIDDIGIVFLVTTLTAFVPGLFSFPGSAWKRKGRAALPRQEQPQAGRACQTGRARAEPGHEGSSAGAERVWAKETKTGFTAIISLIGFSSPQAQAERCVVLEAYKCKLL